MVARIRQNFQLNDSSDEMAVRMAAISYIQFLRAQQAGKEEPARVQAKIVRDSLKDLKATKISREGEGADLKTTPAEWATALLAKVSEANEKLARQARKKGKEAADASRTPEEPQI